MILTIGALLAICVGLYYWHDKLNNPFQGFGVGDFPPTYQPEPHDPRLEIIADQVRPIIARIEAMHQYQGRYPLSVSEIQQVIPLGIRRAGFFYIPTGDQGLGYQLSVKLGWNSALCYSHDASGTSWTFLPGDGSPDRPVDL